MHPCRASRELRAGKLALGPGKAAGTPRCAKPEPKSCALRQHLWPSKPEQHKRGRASACVHQ
eukprot:5895320-Alexandrium_andersonii.AAC.1